MEHGLHGQEILSMGFNCIFLEHLLVFMKYFEITRDSQFLFSIDSNHDGSEGYLV